MAETENTWTLHKYDDPADSNDPPAKISKLAATATSATLPDLTAGATYEAQVRAVTSEDAEGPWSDTGEGTANRPPTAVETFAYAYATYNHGIMISKNLLIYSDEEDNEVRTFQDLDGDTLTYSSSVDYPGFIEVTLISPNRFAELLNPGVAKVTDVANDGYGGVVSAPPTIYTITQNETRDIAENSAGGTAVGDPVTGVPYDDGNPQTDDSLTYRLSGDASNVFVINSATGQISVKQGETLDFETKTLLHRRGELDGAGPGRRGQPDHQRDRRRGHR